MLGASWARKQSARRPAPSQKRVWVEATTIKLLQAGLLDVRQVAGSEGLRATTSGRSVGLDNSGRTRGAPAWAPPGASFASAAFSEACCCAACVTRCGAAAAGMPAAQLCILLLAAQAAPCLWRLVCAVIHTSSQGPGHRHLVGLACQSWAPACARHLIAF